MYQRYFWKQFSFPVQWLRPWMLVSLALHAVVLSAPLLPSATLPEPEETVTMVPIPQLPPASVVPNPPVPNPPVPSSSITVPAAQAIQAPAQRPTPKSVLPPQLPIVVRPARTAVPPVLPTNSLPAPTPAPAAIAPSIPAAVVSPSPTLSPSPTPAISSPTPEATPPYANVPHVAGTTAGCGGRENCWQSADTQWRAIARRLEQDLQTQGYAVSPVDLETETGVRVYRVSKTGTLDYYLNLISTFQGTVYLMSKQPMTAEEIRAEAERQDEG